MGIVKIKPRTRYRYAYNLSEKHTQFVLNAIKGTGLTPERFIRNIFDEAMQAHKRKVVEHE